MDSRKDKLSKLRKQFRELLAKRNEDRKKRFHPVPAPRYDEVYFRGMQEVFGNEDDSKEG